MRLGDISAAGLIPTSSSTITEPPTNPTVAKSSQVADVMSPSSLTGAALLSLLIPKEDGDGTKSHKVWVGAGLPPIPRRVHDRMLKWEYVDLAELRPPGTLEAINPEPDPQRYVVMPGLELASAKKKPIRDIHTWIACFAVYTAVMSKAYPEVVPEFMAYMLTIIRAQKEYEEPAWRIYDEAYRDAAASSGNKQWSKVDESIFAKVFTGRARQMKWCSSCDAIGHDHQSDTCPQAPPRKKWAGEDQKKGATWGGYRRQQREMICWDFNRGHCRFGNQCKYRHMCECGGRHPSIRCPRQGPTGDAPRAIRESRMEIQGRKQ